MRARVLAAVALVVLAGCSRAMLPYRPDPQPPGARLSAAYAIVGDRVRIELDTGGRVLEQVWIVKPDGSGVAPHAVEAPAVVVAPGPTISVGVGSATGGGVGTGVGVGFPVGGGSTRVRGNTVAWFPLDRTGPPPWSVHVKLAGTVPATFTVGGPPPD